VKLNYPTVAIMQPTFLPWQGYFALIDAADIFVFLDDVQFMRRSFHHRNRLFVSGRAYDWVSLPVEHAGQRELLHRTRVSRDPRFVRKTRAMLEQSYRKTPYFELVYPVVVAWLADDSLELLADRNIVLITRLAAMMGIDKTFVRSSALHAAGVRSQLLLNILSAIGAGSYLAASGSFGYMREEGLFAASELPVAFQNFLPTPYPQLQSPAFVPYLSLVDALFQVGPEATLALIRNGAKTFLSWAEREAQAIPGGAPEDSAGGWHTSGEAGARGAMEA
jgi:WbqC-like protein family